MQSFRDRLFIRNMSSRNNDLEPEEQKMNDSTLPPKPTSNSGSNGTKLAAAPRRKTGRFGLADWTRLVKASTDLAQRKGQPLRRNISMREVQQHNSLHDGWIVLRGKVYNLGPYVAYHPGGERILKQVLGKDATELYEKYHRWVSEDGLIGCLLLGYLDKSAKDEDDDRIPYLPQQMTKDGFAVPAPKPPRVVESLLSKEEDDEQF